MVAKPDSGAQAAPALELPAEAEIAVVGAGVIGLAASAFLARAGHDVVTIDAATPGGAASAHNAGQLRPAACVPLAAPGALAEFARSSLHRGRPIRLGPGVLRDWPWPLAFAAWTRSAGSLAGRTAALAELGRASEEAYRIVEEWAGRELIVRAGALDVYETERGWARARKVAVASTERGFAAEALSGTEAREREPSLRAEPAGAIWFPAASHCDPTSVTAALTEIATGVGARLVAGTPVTRISPTRDGELVQAEGRTLRARAVVLAAGAGVRRLLAADAARSVPVIAGRGYGLDLDGGPLLRQSLILVERHISATPWRGGLRLTSGMEIGATGRRLGARIGALRAAAQATLRDFDQRSGRSWLGLRPMTPDGLPLIGRLPGRERIVLAGGHGMLGLTHGPATGRIVAELIGGEPPPWATAFEPARFASGWRPERSPAT